MNINIRIPKIVFNSHQEIMDYTKQSVSEEMNENNKKIMDKLFLYLKNNSMGIHNYFIQKIILSNKLPYDFSPIPNKMFLNLLKEIGSEKNFQFDRKLDSLSAELLTLKILQDEGYTLHDRSNKDGVPDWEMKKNEKIYCVEVKQKESDDFFGYRILSMLQGYSLLKEYSFLWDKSWNFEILMQKDYDAEKQIWQSVLNFLDAKQDCYEDDNITMYNKNVIKDTTLIKKCPKTHQQIQNSYQTAIIMKQSEKDFLNLLEPIIEKLLKKQKQYNNFISAIVFHEGFHKLIPDRYKDILQNIVNTTSLESILFIKYSIIEDYKYIKIGRI